MSFFMKKNTEEIEVKLQSVIDKCDKLLAEIETLRENYVHKDMTSLLNAARNCSDDELKRLRIARRRDYE